MSASEIFVDGKDMGYKNKSGWWNDADDPHFLRISTQVDYSDEYFKEDHVGEKTIENYCNAVIRQYEFFTGRRLKTIIEFGSGGGWFTNEFKKRGYTIDGYEYSWNGITKCEKRGVWTVKKRDFRSIISPVDIDYYDIALCTEVAGHIEPPFSAILVNNLIQHSNLIWWSSEEPGFNKPHLHHPNEQLYQYWINLFDYYNYGAYLLPDDVWNSCEFRGRYIFYNRNKYSK